MPADNPAINYVRSLPNGCLPQLLAYSLIDMEYIFANTKHVYRDHGSSDAAAAILYTSHKFINDSMV